MSMQAPYLSPAEVTEVYEMHAIELEPGHAEMIAQAVNAQPNANHDAALDYCHTLADNDRAEWEELCDAGRA